MKPLDPRLLRHARSARTYIITTAILGVLTATLVIAQALLISATASPVILGTASLTDVMGLIGVLALVVITRGVIVALREALAHRAADKAIRELRSAVITKAERLGPRWRARHGADTATLVTRGLQDLDPYFVKFLPQLLLTATVTPMVLAMILFLDFWSALIALLTIPLIPIFMILIGRFTQESSDRKLASMERLGSQLLDLMAGLPTLRGLGRERGPRDHMRKLGAENTRTTMATLRVAFLSGGVLEFLATLSVALVAVEVGMRLVHNLIPLHIGLAVIMLAPEVFEPLRQVGAQFHASANGVAAANAAFAVLDEPEPTRGRTPAPSLCRSALVIDDLSVAARGTWAPAHMSATILPGTVVALAGPSGVGKTTTAMVLIGLEQATRGSVLIRPIDEDGAVGEVALENIDVESWWRQVAWVPQSPTIVPGTLRSNLPDDTSETALESAAVATGFGDVVASLPHGWDTVVGHGGVGLSVGQRQRLALTRVLLDDSALVVMDEPTAHLDAISEEIVVDTIGKMREAGRTVIVIAHRSAVIAAADDVINIHAQASSAHEAKQWPELTTIETLNDLRVDLPGFLDMDQLDGADNASATEVNR